MTRSRAKVEAAAGLVALFALCACGGGGPADPAATAAIDLFSLAREIDPPDSELAERFERPPVDERGRAALLDALELLAEHPTPEVVAIERSGDPSDLFVDLESALEGGGLARFTVRLTAESDGQLRVRWFQGPGVSWPADGGARN